VISLDASGQNFGPGEVAVVAAAIATNAVVKSLTLSGNNIIGLYAHGRGTEDLSGFKQLCAVMGKLHEVDLSNCNLNRAAMTVVARNISWGSAVLALVNLSSNRAIDQKIAKCIAQRRVESPPNESTAQY
jgi:hypothetical protein